MKTVQAACPHDCPDTCAMRVTVDDSGRAIRIEGDPDHPPTAGVLCTKVSRYLERTYHPERLLTPLKRNGPKGSGRFVPVSWDEALDTIAVRLTDIARRDPQAILPYSYAGTMGLVQGEGMAARFFHRLGASRLERTICSSAGKAALQATFGAGVGMDVEQFGQARVILIWGTNPVVSSVHFWRQAQAAKRRGAILVAIDPYRSLTAQKCDHHLALLPGTDAALALGLMHVLIRDDLLDHDYIAAHTAGFEALKARAAGYTPERVAQLCGIDAAGVETLAQLIGQTAVRDRQAVAIRLNYGMQRTRGGGNAVRAVACLPALLGSWRHAAGGLLLSSGGFYPRNLQALERPDLMPDPPPRPVNMVQIGSALLHPGDASFGPKIEAVIVYNSNPVAVAPDGSKVQAGFARTDLFTVVLEHFQTDTADYADIILPATTQLEHVDIHASYGHRHVVVNHPAIAAPGECRPNTEIFRQLAVRMGFEEPCFRDDDWTLARQAFDWEHPALRDLSWDGLLQQGWGKLAIADAAFAEGGFPTASGRCEFTSTELGAQGLDPLPDFIAPYESPQSNPALAARYPLMMVSPPERHFLNTTFVNITSLRGKTPEPVLEIHPEDAAARGLEDGQLLRIFNDRGTFQAQAVITGRTRPGVVVAPSVWWKKYSRDGRNCNAVTSEALTDMGHAPTFYDCLVQVEAA
ncbi:MAG TPA: molybdopterin oxidoreductase family protein [Thiolinea sp.]|nr:molybdopterin oxidoreductase family protein [Thiolinea sp.]